MMKGIILSVVMLMALSTQAFGYGVGVSNFPLERNYGTFTMEYLGFVSNAHGDGFQARYSRKMNSIVTLDGGLGISNSEYNKRFFAGADIELLPDYGKQPRVSLRPYFQSAEERDTRRNIIGMSPTVSKGFNFWGKEAYPFIGLPVGLVLNRDTKQYEIRNQVALGIVGKLPSNNFENVIVNIEGDFNIQNSYSAVVLGLSFPLL